MHTSIISQKDLLPHLHDPNWRIFDCRFSLEHPEGGRQEYLNAHIPGASYIHLDEDLSAEIIPGTTGRHPLPTAEEMAAHFSKWGIGNDTQVVIYDHGHGGIAARFWWMLHWLGHEAAAVLDGGWAHWQKEGLLVTAAITPFRPQAFDAMPQADWIITAEMLSGKHSCQLVDARLAERYRGEVEPIDPIAGHIPGAVNLPFAENLSKDGLWKSPKALKERFAELEDNDKTTVFYCGSGVTACHNLLARYHAGLGMAKLYAGSWSEWITDPSRDIATGEG